ncbi:MAG: UDP-N-acetylmuramoyl-L-alanyl-D-glutamate--2,6-diaminopimelate ligase [Actinomycetes bacterium]
MRLGDLFPTWTFGADVSDVLVSRIEIDSRNCEPGVVFFALPGTQDDGSRFVQDALTRGADFVVGVEGHVTTSEHVVALPLDVIWDALAEASYRIVGDPQRELQLIGVTGTNGKTSVVTFVTSLLRHLERDAASIGTLTNIRTTPSAPELARTLRAYLSEWAPTPVRPVVSLEVSSHALVQHRVDSLRFDVGIFTNLSRDHLDYHETMENYLEAKARLFQDGRTRHAIVWGEGEWASKLIALVECPVTVIDEDTVKGLTSQVGQLHFNWRGYDVVAPLTGSYNAVNLVVAMEACVQLGENPARVAVAASHVEPVPGRCEVVAVPNSEELPVVVVDYAHTPDGLATTLANLREIHDGRIITLFGCGGDRDAGKRSLMGAIASQLSDVIFITSDNPRTEDPIEIARQIHAGVTSDVESHTVLDRREAIRDALALASQGDLVLIAGKGHEKTQQIGAIVLDFDDVQVAKDLLREKLC